jgi:D-serine deaminase-like pyridoxal phosphate-dependent protein
MGRLPGSTFMPTAERGRDADLFAYPLVGPNIKAFISLVKEFPKTHFYALEDDLSCLHVLQAKAEKQNAVLGWLADVNMGMNRTGVETASEDR